jgi:transcriptional regulator with XRE-family HTH domain
MLTYRNDKNPQGGEGDMMDTASQQVLAHPLACVRAERGGWSMENLAHRIRLAGKQQGLLVRTTRGRVWRWETGRAMPDETSQRLLAQVLGVPWDAVQRLGWPNWLPVCARDRVVLESPWTQEGTLRALDDVAGGSPDMDRRGFLIASSATISAVVTSWTAATAAAATAEAVSPARGRRISPRVADLFDARLDELRRLDDHVGSGLVYDAAMAELRLITSTITHKSYTEATERRLYSDAAEASRICGWTAYDSGRHAAAERHYLAALRASATAADPTVGTNTLAFWAIQRYSTHDPQGAIHLIDAAQSQASKTGSARVRAMLHARAARAHAHAGDARASNREVNAAFDAYARANGSENDPDWVYWVNLGELHQLAGSSALNLGNPHQALAHFEAAPAAHTGDAYDGAAFPRGYAIYLARQSEARLALGDLEGAVIVAHDAVDHMGGVTSARGTNTLTDLRRKLATHNDLPIVRDFLDYTT